MLLELFRRFSVYFIISLDTPIHSGLLNGCEIVNEKISEARKIRFLWFRTIFGPKTLKTQNFEFFRPNPGVKKNPCIHENTLVRLKLVLSWWITLNMSIQRNLVQCSTLIRVKTTLMCDVYTHTVMNTRTSVISTHKVGFPHAKCDFNTQTVMLTRISVIMTLTKLIMTLIRVKTSLCVYKSLLCVINTRTSVISERKVWFQIERVRFPHAECDFYTQSLISTRRVWCWHVWVWLWHSRDCLWHSYHTLHVEITLVCGEHTHKCKFNTHECDLYMQSAISTLRVWFHSCVWCLLAYWDDHTHECNFWTQSVIFICRV
jgi:hypothetical protein